MDLARKVNMLIGASERSRTEYFARMLAAIVESSADAIVSKDLNGIITSWNAGAERLFGYGPEEAVGSPVTMLIPEDHQNEEPAILERIRRGERVEHYDTIRRRKDGKLIEISLTVSPIRDKRGNIIGASKIARDITERKQAEAQQRLLLKEINHRVKNLFSLASSIVSISARRADSPEEMASSVRQRLGALARAHEFVLPPEPGTDAVVESKGDLAALVGAMLEPYVEPENRERISTGGPDMMLGGKAVATLALLLHEFATNAAKYGALSRPEGRVFVTWDVGDGAFRLVWREEGGPPIEEVPQERGFGTLMADAAVAQFSGRISREWEPGGLVVSLVAPLERLAV